MTKEERLGCLVNGMSEREREIGISPFSKSFRNTSTEGLFRILRNIRPKRHLEETKRVENNVLEEIRIRAKWLLEKDDYKEFIENFNL